MFKLVWLIAAMTAQGPATGESAESRTFASREACISYANEMTPRMQDWVRGVTRQDWDAPVGIKFRCEVDGRGV